MLIRCAPRSNDLNTEMFWKVDMQIFKILAAALSINLAFGSALIADELRDSITQTAKEICGDYQYEGFQKSEKTAVSVESRLSGLARAIARIGGDVQYELDTSEWSGVVQNKLDEEITSVRECRVLVWKTLEDKIRPTAHPVDKSSIYNIQQNCGKNCPIVNGNSGSVNIIFN